MIPMLPPNAMTINVTVRIANENDEKEFSANLMAQTNKFEEIKALLELAQGSVRREAEYFLRRQEETDAPNSGSADS